MTKTNQQHFDEHQALFGKSVGRATGTQAMTDELKRLRSIITRANIEVLKGIARDKQNLSPEAEFSVPRVTLVHVNNVLGEL